MNCDEVNIILYNYIDEHLDINSKKEIEKHLQTCDKCYNQYKRLRKFIDKIKQVPFSTEPPSDLIQKLTDELMKRSGTDTLVSDSKSKNKLNIDGTDKGQDKELRSHKTSKRISIGTVLLLILPFIIVGIGYFIYDYSKINSPWKIRGTQGTVFVNNQLNVSDRLDEGENLFTDIDSRAIINIPATGKIEVEPVTLLVLVKAKEGDNKIRLEKGIINVITTEQLPAFAVEIKNVLVKVIYGTFSIKINNFGDAIVNVEDGMIEIIKGAEIYLVDNDHSCIIRERNFPGAPIRSDADEIFKREIENFNRGNTSPAAIQTIISAAKKSDALTLISLISRVQEPERKILFEKISSYFPPPENVTAEKIISLDKQMLDFWWYEIEWQL